MRDDLQSAVDRLLLDSLSPTMRDSIRELVGRGLSRRDILAVCKDMVRRHAAPGRGKLTLAAIEAAVDEAIRESN